MRYIAHRKWPAKPVNVISTSSEITLNAKDCNILIKLGISSTCLI